MDDEVGDGARAPRLPGVADGAGRAGRLALAYAGETRLDGLGDEEYRWEPVPGAWNVRVRRATRQGCRPGRLGGGRRRLLLRPADADAGDDHRVAPRPPRRRRARQAERPLLRRPPIGYGTYDYPLTADRALADLDATYAHWLTAVRALDEPALRAPCGEEGHGVDPMAALVLHIHRELVHHLAEVALLRDLGANGAGRA